MSAHAIAPAARGPEQPSTECEVQRAADELERQMRAIHRRATGPLARIRKSDWGRRVYRELRRRGVLDKHGRIIEAPVQRRAWDSARRRERSNARQSLESIQ